MRVGACKEGKGEVSLKTGNQENICLKSSQWVIKAQLTQEDRDNWCLDIDNSKRR